MATLLTDTFTWADGPLPTVSGGLYAKPSDWPNPIAVASHQAKGTAAGDNACFLASFSGSLTAQWAAITIAALDAFYGPTVFNSTVGDFYLLDVPNYNLYRVRSNQIFTAMASFEAGSPIPPVVGDVIRLEGVVTAGNPVLTALVNGAPIGTFTDVNAAKLTTGAPGVRMWNTVTRLSQFSAGDFAAVAPGGGALDVRTRLDLDRTAEILTAPRLGGGFA